MDRKRALLDLEARVSGGRAALKAISTAYPRSSPVDSAFAFVVSAALVTGGTGTIPRFEPPCQTSSYHSPSNCTAVRPDAREVEELRPPRRPVKVMHRYLREAIPCVLELFHQFQADRAAV